jgi:hypothetical protein
MNFETIHDRIGLWIMRRDTWARLCQVIISFKRNCYYGYMLFRWTKGVVTGINQHSIACQRKKAELKIATSEKLQNHKQGVTDPMGKMQTGTRTR